MFKKILVPIDGSQTAQLAVARAIGLAKAFDSEITVVYVIDPYPFSGVGADFGFGQAQYLSAATAEANQTLEEAKINIQTQIPNLVVNTQIVEGHVIHKGILTAASHVQADLIVMGSHGRQGIEKLILGSVTQRVLSHAHIPVMVVRD